MAGRVDGVTSSVVRHPLKSFCFDGLMTRFGAGAALPDVLMALASCERRADFSRPCGARFTDLAAR